MNMMQQSFAKKLIFRICKTDVVTQKINGGRQETYIIVIVSSQLNDKDKKSHFFEDTFGLPDISINVTFGIFFLTLSKVKVKVNDSELRSRLYTAAETLSITR